MGYRLMRVVPRAYPRVVAHDFNNVFDRSVLRFHTHNLRAARSMYQLDDFFEHSMFYPEKVIHSSCERVDGKWNCNVNLDSVNTKAEDINIVIQKGCIKISGTSEMEKSVSNGTKMTGSREWTEMMKLPNDVDPKTLNASFDKNILSLTAAIEEVLPVDIPISNLD